MFLFSERGNQNACQWMLW